MGVFKYSWKFILFCVWVEYNKSQFCNISIPALIRALWEITDLQGWLYMFLSLSGLLFVFVLIGTACHIANQVELFSSTHLEADLIERNQTSFSPLISTSVRSQIKKQSHTRQTKEKVTKKTHNVPH